MRNYWKMHAVLWARDVKGILEALMTKYSHQKEQKREVFVRFSKK